jgi:hypothetical protein
VNLKTVFLPTASGTLPHAGVTLDQCLRENFEKPLFFRAAFAKDPLIPHPEVGIDDL